MTTEATEILLIKNMTLISVLIWTLLCCCFTESRGQVTVTQSGAVSAALGGSVTMTSVKRPVLISGCPGLSEPLTHQQHNDDVSDSTAGHPGAPCSG
ncbi:immunoglobulin kappa light chain-like isoform X1 [Lates japonicus]|nr:immunoglobulin kappa light chain-like isoform X1 [Lates japonicus]